MGDFIKTLTSLIGSIKAKTDGKIDILQKRIDDIPTETVLYTPQTLTEEQQKQARDNIGATDAGSMFVVITKSVQNGETIYSADKTYDEIMEAVKNKIVPVCNNPVDESVYGPNNVRCIFRNSFYVTGVEYASFQSDGDEYFYEVLIFNGGKVTATSKPKIMTGATTDNSGTSGMVPLPYSGDNTKFLRGDGRWADVPKYELPVAANEQLGGVKPVAKTDVMTQDVGVDENGKLYTKPAEGGTDFSLGITGATPGQIAKITAVDTDGKPTAWEPVDMAGGGLTDAQIAALDGLFKIASYQQDSSAAYEAFKQAFGIADGVIVFAADFSGSSPSAAQFYSWAGRVYGSAIYDALTNIQCVDGAVKLTSVYDSTNSRWVKQMMCTGGLFEADEFICTFRAKFCGTAGSWNSVITYGAGTHWTDGLYSDGIKWPAGGEIDAFEQAGGYAENPNTFKTPTAHWGSGRNSQYPDTHLSRTGESVAFTPDVWHNFKFSLKNGTVKIYIDDTLVGEKDFSDCAVSNNYLADYKPFLKPQAFYIDGSCADTSDTSNSYLFEVKDFMVYQDADVACTGLAIHPQMWANGTTLVFPVGAEIYFDRVYTPANTSNKACVWESTNEDVATVEQGYVKTLATGTTVIRATCGGITAAYTLTVAASASIPCAKLACAQESIIANAGNAITLNVYKYPSFTTDEITVTSGSQDVCTVSGTIVTAVGAGSTEITIQCGTKSVTIPVTVSAAKSPYVAYDFAELAANIGQLRTDENASVAVANTGTAGAAFDLIATAATKDVVVDNAWVTQINYYTAQNSPLETALNLRAQPFLYVAEVRENNGAIYLNGTNANVMPSIACKTNVCNIRYGPVALFEYTPVTPPYVVAIYFDGAKTSVFANAAKIASDGSYDYITDALKYFRFWEPECFNAFKLYVGDTFTDDEIIALTEAQNE